MIKKFFKDIVEKLNPAQEEIYREEGTTKPSTQTNLNTIGNAYELVEVVNRCINMLVDNSCMVNFDVASSLDFVAQTPGVRSASLTKILNNRPNPYMDISTFRRLLIMDFIVDGNAFIYFDGQSIYHLPAAQVEIIPDETTYVNSYVYNSVVTYKANEVIHIKDNSVTSVYRGDSRITSAIQSLLTRESMAKFQKLFFDSGASVGLVLETDEILGKATKERLEREILAKHNPKVQNGRPLILDNKLKAKSIANTNFTEMKFSENVAILEDKVCIALGVPPILLNSGNNANIKPNLELLFYTTILPMLRKFEAAFEFFFAYDIELSVHRVPALKPDQKDEAERVSALVNNGILTGNEGRVILRYPELDDEAMKKIRIPANIAGSATQVEGQEGGRPAQEDKKK